MSTPVEISIGATFGRWTVIGDAEYRRHGGRFYPCRCACGTVRPVRSVYLRRGSSQSCGCLAIERTVIRSTTHGQSKRTRLYRIWQGMLGRCYLRTHSAFERYGDRGVTVCDEWRQSFEVFRDWALANGYADGLTIDRRDNDGSYSPSNCRWLDHEGQAQNKRTTRRISAFGATKTITEWASDSRCVVARHALMDRINKGWPIERALTQRHRFAQGTS